MFKDRTAIGEQIKALRKRAQLTGTALAKRLGCTQSFISKIERGEVKPEEMLIRRISRALRLSSSEEHELISITKAFLFSYDRWNQSDSSVRVLQEAVNQRVSQSSYIASFAQQIVSGSLQTDEYAEAVLRFYSTSAISKNSIEEFLELRRKRKKLLKGKRIIIIQAEAALGTWILSSESMKNQLKSLIDIVDLGEVELRILPLNKFIKSVPLSSFSVYDNQFAVTETPTFSFQFWERDDVEKYNLLFQSLIADSVVGSYARRIIEKYLDLLQRHEVGKS